MQGEQIDNIEKNVTMVAEFVKDAKSNLEQAETHQKSARRVIKKK